MKRAASACLSFCVLVSCGKKPDATPPPPPVTFAVAEARDVPLSIETFGNCETVADVTLQAQATGNLLKYAVAQGGTVKSGDLVAEIDPAPYQAALQEAQGNLDSAQANLVNMQLTLQRQTELYKTKTVDLADLQTAQANELDARGKVLAAEGDLATAKINLAYCRIASPVDGKAGLYLVDAGNLVTADQTKIINIQTMDPIYVNFTISENDFDRVRQYFTKDNLPVQVTVPGNPGNVITGNLTFLNNNISSDTGTLMLEATFPNPDLALWPGLFVNVSLVLTTLENATVVPASCVMIGQQGPYVFLVNGSNTVTQRQVTTGQRHGDFMVITEGISANDRVVTAGQLGLVDGKTVSPQPWQQPAAGK